MQRGVKGRTIFTSAYLWVQLRGFVCSINGGIGNRYQVAWVLQSFVKALIGFPSSHGSDSIQPFEFKDSIKFELFIHIVNFFSALLLLVFMALIGIYIFLCSSNPSSFCMFSFHVFVYFSSFDLFLRHNRDMRLLSGWWWLCSDKEFLLVLVWLTINPIPRANRGENAGKASMTTLVTQSNPLVLLVVLSFGNEIKQSPAAIMSVKRDTSSAFHSIKW